VRAAINRFANSDKSITDPNDGQHLAFFVLKCQRLIGNISRDPLNSAIPATEIGLGALDHDSLRIRSHAIAAVPFREISGEVP
jgi:hypothetical protein